MAEEILESPMMGAKPLEHAVPSLDEPPSEVHGQVSREEEAERALKSTLFTPGACALLVALFLLTLAAVPILQFATEIKTPQSSGLLPLFNVFKILPTWSKIASVQSLGDLWHLLPPAGEIKAAEKAMENESVVSLWLRPRIQSILTHELHAGTEQVYPGRDGWLFYRPDVDYVTGSPFLSSAQMKQRTREAGVQPDPIKAIVDFRNQLAARGIELIVMPVPGKPCIDGEMLATRTRQKKSLQNASFAER